VEFFKTGIQKTKGGNHENQGDVSSSICCINDGNNG
jgi:hypothetical protein